MRRQYVSFRNRPDRPTETTFQKPQLSSVVGVSCLALSVIWVMLDPVACQLFDFLRAAVNQSSLSDQQVDFAIASFGTVRICASIALVVIVAVSACVWCRGFVTRGGRILTVRGALFQLTLVAFWCGFLCSYQFFAWQGKRIRMLHYRNEVEAIARDLRSDWPQQDGEIDAIGPFMSYPFGRPTVLVLLSPPPIASAGTVVSAIDRNDDGVLRFQLGGVDGGDWIEWHPDDLVPQGFLDGLGTAHHLETSSALGAGWYLVRYV